MTQDTKIAGWSIITAIAALMILMTTEFDKDIFWALGWLLIAILGFWKMYRADDYEIDE